MNEMLVAKSFGKPNKFLLTNMLAGLYLYGIGARRQLFQSHFVELLSSRLTAFVFSQDNSAGHIRNGDYYRCVFRYHVAHEELFMRGHGP